MAAKKGNKSSKRSSTAEVRKTLAVAVALGRAKVLRSLLQEVIERHPAGQLPGPSGDDWRKFRVNDATRLASLMIAYFTALNAVIDGWKINGLADARVDELLRSPHAQPWLGSGMRFLILEAWSMTAW